MDSITKILKKVIMHKITISLIIVSILSLSVHAEEGLRYIDIGGNGFNIHTKDTNEQKIGSGFDISLGEKTLLENNIVFGIQANYGQATVDNAYFDYYGADMKLGFYFRNYKDLTIYGIGSWTNQRNNIEAQGFGMGCGLEFIPFKNLGIGTDYIHYDMDPTDSTTSNYYHKVIKVYIKIIFSRKQF